MVVDLARRADGLRFFVHGGRYLLPAYGAVVVLFVAGVRELVRRELRPLVFTAIGSSAVAFGAWVYCKFSLTYYFGRPGLGELSPPAHLQRAGLRDRGLRVGSCVLLIGASWPVS